MIQWLCLLLCGGSFGCAVFSYPAVAAMVVADDEQTIDTERAFKSLRNAKWYDQETQGYAPPAVAAERDNPLREQGWRATPKPPRKAGNWNWNWGLSGLLGEFLSWAVFGLLVLALVVAIVMLAWHLLRSYLPGFNESLKKTEGISIDPARVAALPFDVRPTHRDPLAEAEMLMQSGRYNEAIVFLFGYLLLVLDQSRKIHLQKGKTNRMYLRELRGQLQLRNITETTMLAFEDVFFGKHSITRERFESIWNRLDEFHSLLAPPKAITTTGSSAEVAPT